MSVTRKRVKNLIGARSHNLTVVEYLGKGKHNKHYWRCVCDCGGETTQTSSQIGKPYGAKTCGCLRIESLLSRRFDGYKHGLHKHPLYAIYHSMKYRCSNENSSRWQYYGGKGVSICDEWLSDFKVFYDWAVRNGYEEGLTIDRLDNSKGYSPENCEWVTRSENSRRMNEVKHGRPYPKV